MSTEPLVPNRPKNDSNLGASLQDFSRQNQSPSSEKDVTKRYQFDSLSTTQFWAYCMGHMINDLSAACWFNYLLFYLKYVIKFNYGSYAMLSGQVADALATPAVGIWSDQTRTKIGKRIPWYIGGYFVIVISFLPVWNGNLLLGWLNVKDSQTVLIVYYVVFPAVFNFGWASLQISHMSLVPSLTCCRSRRDKLNSIRNTFQFIAVLIVYLTALTFFSLSDTTDGDNDSAKSFQYLSIICVAIGTITSVFFIMQINEPKLTSDCNRFAKQLVRILQERKKGLNPPSNRAHFNQTKSQVSDSQLAESQQQTKSVSQDSCLDTQGDVKLSDVEFSEDEDHNLIKQRTSKGSMSEEVHDWKDWFTQMAFYRFGLVYMFVRLYCNVSSTMISFYIASVLQFTDIEAEEVQVPIQVALIPLSLYLMSVITSAGLATMYRLLGKKVSLTLGTIICLATSTALVFLTKETRWIMYVVSPFIGVAQAITLNTGITLISDVIGLKGSQGAFVFGAYSFLDKISTGIALFVCSYGTILEQPNLVRWITVLVPSMACVLGCVLVVTAPTKKSEDEEGEEEGGEQQVKGRSKSLQDELAV